MRKILNNPVLLEILIRVAIVVVIFLFTIVLARVVRWAMSKKETFVRVEGTRYKFLTHFFSGIIYFLGILLAIYSIPPLRGLATSIFAGSGVLAVIIGFASQQTFANIVSGIFIAVYKPIRVGDRVKLLNWDFITVVEDINLRHTVLRTFENRRIIVPNSVISGEILENSNIVDARIQKFFEIGISYDSDVDKAISIIQEEVLKHPEFLDNRSEEQIADGEEPVKVRVIGFGESSVNLRAYVWAINPSAAFIMGCDLNKSVKARFDGEGIEIPFPYRTLVFKDKDGKAAVPV